MTLKHVLTVGIWANDKHPAGPTSTANGRPSLLGWLIATLVNELVAKHSSRGNVLRSNAKQLAQFAVGHSRSVAGNVCCAASLCIPGKDNYAIYDKEMLVIILAL